MHLQEESRNSKSILLVMPELFWGGAETQYRFLIQGINRDKYELSVLVEHSKREKNEQDQTFIQLNGNTIFHEPLDSAREHSSLLSRIKGLKSFFSEMEVSNRPDVVLVYGGAALLLIPWLKSKGFIVCYSDRNGGKDTFRQRIKQFFYRPSDVIVCNSKPTFKRRGKVHKNVLFIPNGTRVLHSDISSGYKSNTILMVSRIARVKNIECAIWALSHLPKEFSISIVGKTEDQGYEGLLKKLAIDLGVAERVHFEGYSNNLEPYFESSFCTVLPSFEEGMPNAVLESWAHGRLAIVSDIPANKELVDDPSLLFPCEAPEVLARRIIGLKSLTKDEYDELCRESRNVAKENYSIESMVSRYERLFDALT